MNVALQAEIKAFVAERDAVLTKGDIAELRAFHRKHNPDMPDTMDDLGWKIALHKARLASNGISEHVKAVSRLWLRTNGYSESLGSVGANVAGRA